jgi:succinate dehydrogenase/fumarate reductase flavoprotein subunit
MTGDVVVLGYGPAGAAAAIAAHDAGSRVVIVESTSRGGGNAVYSGGFLFDLPDEFILDHLEALSFGRTDRSVLEAYAAGLHGVDGWLTSLGATTVAFEPAPIRLPAPFPSWPKLSSGPHVRYRVVGGGDGRRGAALWDVLDAAVRSRGIEVRFDAPAKELLLDRDRVTGVLVGDGAAGTALYGSVVLATGGFEGDAGLVDSFLPLGPAWPVGHPGNTGGGLRMAQAVGADLWHMYGFFGWFAFRAADFGAPFAIDFFGPGHIVVDADGHRFADETGYEVHDRLRALLTYLPRNPNRDFRAGRSSTRARDSPGLSMACSGRRTATSGVTTTPPKSIVAG